MRIFERNIERVWEYLKRVSKESKNCTFLRKKVCIKNICNFSMKRFWLWIVFAPMSVSTWYFKKALIIDIYSEHTEKLSMITLSMLIIIFLKFKKKRIVKQWEKIGFIHSRINQVPQHRTFVVTLIIRNLIYWIN